MKINEIIFEDDNTEGDNLAELSANLLPVLMFLKKQGSERGVVPKLRTDSLIQLVKNAGDGTFDYAALVDAHENNDAVKELIKSFNKDEVVLSSDSDVENTEVTGDNAENGEANQWAMSPEEQVDSMSKRAMNKRQ